MLMTQASFAESVFLPALPLLRAASIFMTYFFDSADTELQLIVSALAFPRSAPVITRLSLGSRMRLALLLAAAVSCCCSLLLLAAAF